MDTSRLRKPKQIVEMTNNAITMGTLRKWLANRKTNGLDKATVKIGSNLLVDIDAFNKWLETYRESNYRKKGER